MAGTSLGTAYVQIVPSADGIKGSITEALGGEAQAAGTSTGSKIAAFAKKALATGAVIKVLKDTLEEGGKLQQSYIGGLETIYEGAEDQIRSYARAAADAGISMNTYAEQAVSFGAALKQSFGSDIAGAAKAADQAIMDMADNSAKMGTDITSIQNAYQGFAKQNYTMLDNLKLGYGGTKTEMERLLADAEELSGVHYNIENLGDVYDAIHVIQEELNITGTAANEAGSTLTGALAAVKANFQNFIGSMAIGEDIKEPLNGLINSISNFAFNNLIPMIGQVIQALPGAIVQFITQGIPVLLSNLGNLVSSIADSIREFASGITAEKVTTWAQTMLPKIMSSAGDMLAGFAEGILRNVGKIALAVGKIGLAVVKGLGSAIWDKVKEAAKGVKERFLEPINALRDNVKTIIDKIKDFFSFKISAPNVPLPHFSVSPSGWKISDLLKGSIPKLGVKWYAEGGIATSPTLFGGMGEAGPEAILPLDPFWKRLDRWGESLTAARNSEPITVILQVDGKEVARTTAPYMETELNRIQTRANRKLGYI